MFDAGLSHAGPARFKGDLKEVPFMNEVVSRAIELLVMATPIMFGATLLLIAVTKALVMLFPRKASEATGD